MDAETQNQLLGLLRCKSFNGAASLMDAETIFDNVYCASPYIGFNGAASLMDAETRIWEAGAGKR